ncbi:MAG: DNA/RNA helicase domain-containing protein [bacterium]
MNIYPSIISKEEFNSNAEYKVYKHAIDSKIFEKNSKRFLFHSVKNPTPGNHKLMGETDFIYLDRDIILFIEVKGKQVKYDPNTNKWWVMDGTKEKDPFFQAAENLFNYRDKKLPALFQGKEETRRLIWGYSVFFPDCLKPESLSKHKSRNIEYDPELIVDFNDFKNKSFKKIIDDLKNYWRHHESYQRSNPIGISSKELFKIKNFIRQDIVFQFPWVDLLKRNDEKFKRYTDEAQEYVLTMLEDNPQMGAIVKGGPGTGKTWLALEHAKRQSNQGNNVLFLCFNKNLAYYLEILIQELDAKYVKVIHKDAFYSQMLEKHTGASIDTIKKEWLSVDSDNVTDFWKREVPLRVYQFFKDYQLEKFDFLIMDEAQDYFSEYHIDALSCFLKSGFESGHFLICMDDESQDIYQNYTKEFENYFRTIYPNYIARLKYNCRNPQKLSDTAFYLTGLTKQECYFKEEVKNSELKYYKDIKDLKNRVLSFIDDKKKNNVNLNKISILCFDKNIKNQIIEFDPDIFTDISKDNIFQENKVTISTAHAFKGLENHFILFIGPENYSSDNQYQKKVIFNAFTRAKYQFIYLMNEKYRHIIDNEFANNVIQKQ